MKMIRKHLKYLWYVVRHKWFVFLEACKLGVPHLGIIHDWSKFLSSEWFPYANFYYGLRRDETGYYKSTDTGDNNFDFAWFLHQKRNKHHWQYWVLIKEGGLEGLDIPLKYKKEMLADWRGAKRAQKTPSVKVWYNKHRQNMIFHSNTHKWIEKMLGGKRDG